MAKLLSILSIIAFPKGQNYQINKYLNSDEVDCKCERTTCHYTLLNEKAANYFLIIRGIMGVPLYLNSFYRCQSHNEEVGGVDASSHTTGNALDISFSGLDASQKNMLVALCREYFDYVKIYDNFIHCQLNE